MAKTFESDASYRDCWACRKLHGSAVWHYRTLRNGEREWICGLQFLVLNAQKDWGWVLLP